MFIVLFYNSSPFAGEVVGGETGVIGEAGAGGTGAGAAEEGARRRR